MLALRLLWRNWRSGEAKLLAFALFLAVAVVSGIAIFTDRLERTLTKESNSVLGADVILRSPQPHDSAWSEAAAEAGVRQARAAVFASMVFSNEHMHLASVKAVDGGYPLRGQFEISQLPFASNPDDIHVAEGVPAPGEAWVDSRLLPLLNVGLGDEVSVGEYSLKLTRILIREPDASSPFSFMGARLLMNLDDLPNTQVVQEGSRVEYHWLLAADDNRLERFLAWLKPRMNDHQRLVDVESAQQGLGRTLETGRRFLLLAAVIGVLLAGVAIALASRQFSARHVDQVALMKSLGMSATAIRRLYFVQLLALALVASLLGLLLGELLQRFVAESLREAYSVSLNSPRFLPYGLSLLSGLLCLLGFALPALWFLPQVPPIKILRRELQVRQTHLLVQAAVALFSLILLVVLFSRDIKLALSLVLALGSVLLVSTILALGLLYLSRKMANGAGSIWRLALANMQRRRGQSLVQIIVFATALMLLLTITIVRTSLIEEWQVQVPEDAPNHFLVNIPDHEVAQVQALIDQGGFVREPLYPMVRGRVTHINGEEVTEAQKNIANVLRREANLTWSDVIGSDNKLVAGHWWPEWQPREAGLPGVSIEAEFAQQLGLSPGDKLSFSLGGLTLDAEVASVRSLDWRSMKPNFFFIFQPGSLEDYSPTYITSLYLPPEKKSFINDLLRQHPTTLVIELDRVINHIRSIVTQVSNGVQLVLWLTLLGGCLVLLSAVTSSIDSRKQEAGLLRALGSKRQLILGSVWIEFSVLGLLAGTIAVAGAEFLLLSLQRWVLQTPIQPHYLFWLLGPMLGAVFVGGLGVLSCRSVVTTPPAVVLREAA